MIRIVSLRALQGRGVLLDCPCVAMNLTVETPPAGLQLEPARVRVLSELFRGSLPNDIAARLAESDPATASCLLALMLQKLAGHEVEQHAVRNNDDKTITAAFELHWPRSATTAGQLAVGLLNYLLGTTEVSRSKIVEGFEKYQEVCAVGPTIDARYLFGEARKLGIPVAYKNASTLIFGQGIHLRTMKSKWTDRTAWLSARQARDKTATLGLLAAAGLPVPGHAEVSDAATAITMARRLGFPVVVKPVRTDKGVGITTDITDSAGVERAYATARRFDQRVAVEKFIPGHTFRLLVIGGQFVAASLLEPTRIIGNGKSTVLELVDEINRDPARGLDHQKPLTRLLLDAEAEKVLENLALTKDSVLERGRSISLRSTSNLSRGGLSRNVTEYVHEENRRLAEICAALLRLDLTGIDFRATAIDVPWQSSGGVVIDVNPTPGIRSHHCPAIGEGIDVAKDDTSRTFTRRGAHAASR